MLLGMKYHLGKTYLTGQIFILFGIASNINEIYTVTVSVSKASLIWKLSEKKLGLVRIYNVIFCRNVFFDWRFFFINGNFESSMPSVKYNFDKKLLSNLFSNKMFHNSIHCNINILSIVNTVAFCSAEKLATLLTVVTTLLTIAWIFHLHILFLKKLRNTEMLSI